jgi:hypothetical protein
MLHHFDSRFILVALTICCVPVNHVAAQQSKTLEPIVVNGSNNEATKAQLDLLAQTAGDDRLIIAIARLGSREVSPKLSRGRARTIRHYLENVRAIPKRRIITADGESVNGLGRIEIYLCDRLFMVFTLKHNEDFAKER